MEFVAGSYPLHSAQLVSFGNFIGRVKQITRFAVSAIIGSIFSAILTLCFALGRIFLVPCNCMLICIGHSSCDLTISLASCFTDNWFSLELCSGFMSPLNLSLNAIYLRL